ncbi:MAG: GNAT family N-acetyltransferase [Oligoflexia bacterium]|nr:GNAT family N-acetyltransferase [Oligoflexia bacterium]
MTSINNNLIFSAKTINQEQLLQTAKLIYSALPDFYNLFFASFSIEEVYEVITNQINSKDAELEETHIYKDANDDIVVGAYSFYQTSESTSRQFMGMKKFYRKINLEKIDEVEQNLAKFSKNIPKITDDGSYLARFAVDHNFQGKGIANALMEDFIKQSNAHAKCYLHVKKDNLRAINFYKKTGWGVSHDSLDYIIMCRNR